MTSSSSSSVSPALASLAVSDEIRARIASLLEAVQAALGAKLAGVLAHGSVARGEWVDVRSDVELLLVLRDAELDTLESIAKPLRVARSSARIECTLLTVDEIPRAADAFPIFYEDVRRCRVLLAGGDAFEGLVIHDEHLRLRVEQELRDVQLRLRRSVTDTAGGPSRVLGDALARKIAQLRSPLAALLALIGRKGERSLQSERLEAVLVAAGEQFGVSSGPLLAPHHSPAKTYAALSQLLAKSIDVVDRLETAKA